jgi:PAS domain S-box-containing protein
MDVFRTLLTAETGLAHGWCLLWQTPLIWLHVGSDALIALAFYVFPVALIYVLRKRGDLAFTRMFWLFGVFSFACGTTHLMSIWTLWQPVYGLEGGIKALTAVASVATAVWLMALLPKALALPSPAQLEIANRSLQHEVAERRETERALSDRVRQQAMVADLGQRALMAADIDTLLDDAVRLVAPALGVEFCEVLELQPNGQSWRRRASLGWTSGSVDNTTISAGAQSLAGYTLRADQPVIVEDLRTDSRFTAAPFLPIHGAVSAISVLIRGQDRPFGVLAGYTAQQRQFTQDDLNSLQAVAHVVALVLERTRTEDQARQLIREQAARAAAEAAQMRLAFLADVSVALAASLDYEATLAKLAPLAVPFLADWCAVDILDADDTLRRLPVAHADPTRGEVARQLQAYPPDREGSHSGMRVLHTGRSEYAPEVSNERLVSAARNAEHLELLRALGLCSSIIVPLLARGHTLGIMTLITAESGRRFTSTDLALAEELARRCGVALDNARLYQEAQAATRDQEEARTLLDTLLTSAPVGIGFFDRELRYVRVNQALAAINGTPVEAHPGRTPDELLPQLTSVLRPLRRQVLETRDPIVNMEISGETPATPGQVRHWLVSYYPVRLPEKPLLGLGTVVVDITEHRQMEERLQASLNEKEVLLREIHHRVKNNLQIVSSLLDLQAESLTDPQVRTIFEESQQRIQAMALIHESLYQSDDLAHIDAAQYINRLCARLGQAYAPLTERVAVKVQAEAVWLEVQTAIACGLILQELLSNGFKHAFSDGQSGEIQITLQVTPDQQAILTVRDTGVGFPESLDFRTTDSLGLQLVCLLTEQLAGTISLERREGTVWTLTFPRIGASTREQG